MPEAVGGVWRELLSSCIFRQIHGRGNSLESESQESESQESKLKGQIVKSQESES